MGYMGSLTPSHVWGAQFRQSSSACMLEQIDPVTFLDWGRRACHNKSDRDAKCTCRPSPNLSVGIQGQEPGNQLLTVLGTTPGKRRRSFRCGARPGCSVSRLLPCLSCSFRTRDRTARVGWESSDRQRGEALPRPRCWRPADGSSPSGGIFVAGRNIIIGRLPAFGLSLRPPSGMGIGWAFCASTGRL